MFEREKIISCDIQGWPIFKMTLREVLEEMGFKEIESEGKKYIAVESGDVKLDSFPMILEDDGMGYGTNEKYIISSGNDVCDNNGEKRIYLFAEKYIKELVDKVLEDLNEK